MGEGIVGTILGFAAFLILLLVLLPLLIALSEALIVVLLAALGIGAASCSAVRGPSKPLTLAARSTRGRLSDGGGAVLHNASLPSASPPEPARRQRAR